MKSSKKALIASVATIGVCSALIAGATFAYFTDDVTTDIAVTAANVELSAHVDEDSFVLSSMGVEMSGNTFENGGNVAYSGGELEINLITPGDKVEFDIVVENKSDIAIKYQTMLTADNAKLLSGLAVAVDGEALAANGTEVLSKWTKVEKGVSIDPVHVEIELPVEAGNEYKTESCTLHVKVNAIQGNAQTFDNVNEFIDAAKVSGTINLSADVDVSNADKETGVLLEEGVDLTVNGFNNTITLKRSGFYYNYNNSDEAATVTFKNVHFKAATPGYGYAFMLGANSKANVIFENCTFEDLYTAIYCNQNAAEDAATVTFTGCKYINTTWGYSVDDTRIDPDIDVVFDDSNTHEGFYIGDKEDFSVVVIKDSGNAKTNATNLLAKIDAATTDTIYVNSGEYDFSDMRSSSLAVNADSISIIGAGAERIIFKGSVVFGNASTASGAGWTLKGVTVKGSGTSIGVALNSNTQYTGATLTIEDCIIDNFGYGTQIASGVTNSKLIVKNTVFKNIANAAISVKINNNGTFTSTGNTYEASGCTNENGVHDIELFYYAAGQTFGYENFN